MMHPHRSDPAQHLAGFERPSSAVGLARTAPTPPSSNFYAVLAALVLLAAVLASSASAQTPPQAASQTSGQVPGRVATSPTSLGQVESKAGGSESSLPLAIAPAPLPPRPGNRRSIGVVFGGGGALGLSEIGVLQWMEEHHIPVDMATGTSMGCMVAALYSTGRSVDQLKTVMNESVYNSVFAFHSTFSSRSFRRREDSRELPNAVTVGLRHGVSLRNSLLTDTGLNAFLDREFVSYGEGTDFNKLPIPIRCIATDLQTAEVVTFAHGSLPDAVRASISLPGIYRPVSLGGHEYVDGGVLDNLPTDTMRALKPDVVIAISLPLNPTTGTAIGSLVGILQRSFSVAIEGAEREQRKLADVVVIPDLNGFDTTDYLKGEQLSQRGYEAAERDKAQLLPYAVTDAEWQQYLEGRRAKRRGRPGTILHVRVTAPTEAITRAVERKFEPLIDHPTDPRKVDALLEEVRSDGRYDADYTIRYGPAPNETAAKAESDRPTIVVTVMDKKTGPPFLLAGLNVQAQTAGVTRATVEGIFLHQDLGGYGSELRGQIRLGYLTDLNAEYYRRLRDTGTAGGFFAAPHGGLFREPFYIYSNQHRVSERELQRAGGGGDVGWSDSRQQELRLGWEENSVHWTTVTGSDGQPEVLGSAQRAHIRYVYDTQDRALVPRFGMRSTTDLAYLYNAVNSPNAPQFQSNLAVTHALGEFTLAGRFEGGTSFDRNLAQPFRFTLGGPLRLSASAIDEFRGTDYFLVAPAVLRRVAKLPAPLGESIYLGLGYEAGQIRAPDSRTITRQDVFFGIIAETPLGVLTLAPSVGDGGHRKFNFTLGKVF